MVESTDELGNDLAGVMALQRRLAGMERDLDAIQAKVCHASQQCSLSSSLHFISRYNALYINLEEVTVSLSLVLAVC